MYTGYRCIPDIDCIPDVICIPDIICTPDIICIPDKFAILVLLCKIKSRRTTGSQRCTMVMHINITSSLCLEKYALQSDLLDL